MQYNPLGTSGLSVSDVCLGTMTWGIQNVQSEADAQLSMALEAGINFIDTAEMYPVPPNESTYGDTERILGNWLARNTDKRSDLVVMTKVVGPGFEYIRNGDPITPAAIDIALDDSLKRLHTDYVDVYQLHWPNRPGPHFAKHWPWRTDPTQVDVKKEKAEMADIVLKLGEKIKEGKIRHWGLSDDTPWGIHTYLSLCDELGVPKPVSIQNEFSLLHAKDWPYLIETCAFEDVAYLPWSSLAAGMLTGKYLDGARPKGSRWTMEQRQGLFRDTKAAQNATKAYILVAEKHGITPAQLALKWVQQVSGVTSTIIGATNTVQLKEDIDAFVSPTSEELVDDIHDVFKQYPVPF
ncbi:aldo/keto reductase [Alteromonas sp. 5E99-2]|uniref:aldo/keto reductase n=1 Tax=Alteromonas sp. 5E99-2 TaxID=2817683 RepID=UPI001A99B283|nr:aldo/keto reductase [Alteromonas sp. 5E99-2]MBO1254568.1 aldo/keto reductase [Alteromonas sp. 5E99-2]